MAKLQILRSSLHMGLQAKVTGELNGELVHDPTGYLTSLYLELPIKIQYLLTL